MLKVFTVVLARFKKRAWRFPLPYPPWKRSVLDSTDLPYEGGKFTPSLNWHSNQNSKETSKGLTPSGTYLFRQTNLTVRMYRNFGSQGRGNPTYTGGVTEANTGSPGSSSATSSQQEQVNETWMKHLSY